jgi:hypothetical protein
MRGYAERRALSSHFSKTSRGKIVTPVTPTPWCPLETRHEIPLHSDRDKGRRELFSRRPEDGEAPDSTAAASLRKPQ